MSFYDEHAGNCPVSLDTLAALYRADPAQIAGMIAALSGEQKVALAVYCYGRAHFRELGLAIASACEATALARFAGVMGQVIWGQSRGRIQDFGLDGVRASALKRKVSLAKAAA